VYQSGHRADTVGIPGGIDALLLGVRLRSVDEPDTPLAFHLRILIFEHAAEKLCELSLTVNVVTESGSL